MSSTQASFFETAPFAKGLMRRNRVVMAPVTTWSGNDDGTVSVEEERYYRRRVNGVGLVSTGSTHVAPNGIGFTGKFRKGDPRISLQARYGEKAGFALAARKEADELVRQRFMLSVDADKFVAAAAAVDALL